MSRASTTLPSQASSVPTARRWAESLLEAWGLPEVGWQAAQVVSELATNCTLHTRTDYTLSLVVEAAVVRLEVRDGSIAPPQRRQYGQLATTGRGMAIVEALAVEWGVEQHDDGKTVWVVLQADGGDGSTEPTSLTTAGQVGAGHVRGSAPRDTPLLLAA